MTGNLANDVLETERRAVEQLERPCNSLQEICRVPLGRFILRPSDATNFRHRREAIVHNRRIAVRFPGIAPGPVDANPSLATRVLARHVVLIVGPWRLNGGHAYLTYFSRHRGGSRGIEAP